MKRWSWIGACALILLPLWAVADNHELPEPSDPPASPGTLTDVWMVVPKPGMQGEFTGAIKKHMAFRVEAGESRSWMAFRPVLGDNLAVVQFRSCCFEYADLDGFTSEEASLGIGADWATNVDPYVDHYHHYLEINDWENSHWPEGANGPYYGVTSWTWKQDAGSEPEEIRKKFSQLAKDGWGETGDGQNWLWLKRIGGKPRLAVVSSMESLADMAPDEPSFFEFIAEKLGSEEQASKMFTEFGAGFASSDYTVWVYDAELATPGSD